MFWNIILAALGAAEEIVPIFIHNPQSQKVEAVIVTTVNEAVSTLAPPQGSTGAAQPATGPVPLSGAV